MFPDILTAEAWNYFANDVGAGRLRGRCVAMEITLACPTDWRRISTRTKSLTQARLSSANTAMTRRAQNNAGNMEG